MAFPRRCKQDASLLSKEIFMSDPFKTHGAFSWNELITTDAAAAKKFYAELLGWTYKDMDMGQGVYSVVGCGGKDIAGIMATPAQAAGMPPAWGAYITVDNVDAVAEKAQALGATIMMPPQDIPMVGRFCWLRDPQGAPVAIITYLEGAGS
jgi:predicted enzyme related to lactoylglutathione lyase